MDGACAGGLFVTCLRHIGGGEDIEPADEGQEAGNGLDGVEREFAEGEEGFSQLFAVALFHALLQFEVEAGDGDFFELAAQAALGGDATGEPAGIGHEGAAEGACIKALL
ncbi:MAG: hypothetical protein IPK83_10540 [Planctomycetes bacterium]|nr:hypothetical protein [Planctomycetota bacterium]